MSERTCLTISDKSSSPSLCCTVRCLRHPWWRFFRYNLLKWMEPWGPGRLALCLGYYRRCKFSNSTGTSIFSKFPPKKSAMYWSSVFISGDETHTELFSRCPGLVQPCETRYLQSWQRGIRNEEMGRRRIQEHIPPPVPYAAQNWPVHLQSNRIVDQLMNNPIPEDIYSFREKHFLHWLEVLGINQAGVELWLR